VNGSLISFGFTTCACRACDGAEYVGWRPCPSSLCERRSHVLIHRIVTSGRDYRYGGFGAWLRWIVFGVPADEGQE
jgi:hypothetical protein